MAQKLILRNFQSPGDIVMLTAAVRDLHNCYPGQFITDVRTSCPDLWLNNPYLTSLNENDPETTVLDCHYPLIHQSNILPYHFIFGFIDYLNEKLNLNIRPTAFKGDIHLSNEEKNWMSQVEEITGMDTPFWLIVSGGKYDFTTKWWAPERYQEVVDHFRGKIQFVQIGQAKHHHPILNGAINLIGKTNLRQLVRLVYHAEGVVTPVSLLMHLAAAVETKPNRLKNRPAVVVAGGREPVQWEAYPHHQFIHTNGALSCCDNGGCWKSRVVPLGDGDEKDQPDNLCVDVVGNLPRCLDLIESEEVCRRINVYYTGGCITKMKSFNPSSDSINSDLGELNEQTAKSRAEEFIKKIPPYPAHRFSSKGIVICGGGKKYLPSIWILVNMLRRLGCQLPIELWHLGQEEIGSRAKQFLRPFNVHCIDALEVQKDYPSRTLRGWESKPYAIIHSSFEEVLFLDADNFPVKDPSYLFESEAYLKNGAIFWPDIGQLSEDDPIWKICGIKYQAEPEFETGQILVNKKQCWNALQLTMWYNEYSDFFYRYIHGDKDTFHLAFRKLNQPYSMVPHLAKTTQEHIFYQHDFQGNRIFQHRRKWSLEGNNPPVKDYWLADKGHFFLSQWKNIHRLSTNTLAKV